MYTLSKTNIVYTVNNVGDGYIQKYIYSICCNSLTSGSPTTTTTKIFFFFDILQWYFHVNVIGITKRFFFFLMISNGISMYPQRSRGAPTGKLRPTHVFLHADFLHALMVCPWKKKTFSFLRHTPLVHAENLHALMLFLCI